MAIPHYQHIFATALSCSVLFHNCQTQPNALEGEVSSADSAVLETPLSAMHDALLHLPVSVPLLPDSSDHTAHSEISSKSQETLTKFSFRPSFIPPSVVNRNVQQSSDIKAPFSHIIPASSGARACFRSHGSQWQALVTLGSGADTPYRMLPVVSAKPIGPQLSWLQSQSPSTARAYVHVISAVSSPHGRSCVYLGRLGLLGGMERSGRAFEATSPYLRVLLDSDEACTEVYHIPPGYRYQGYRLQMGAVFQRASCTVRYVEAATKEAIEKAIKSQNECPRDASLPTAVSAVSHSVLLSNIETGQPHTRTVDHQVIHQTEFDYAAVVVHARTKRNKLFRKRSRLSARLDIFTVDERASGHAHRSASLQSGYISLLNSQIEDLRTQLLRVNNPSARPKSTNVLPIPSSFDASVQAEKEAALKTQIDSLSTKRRDCEKMVAESLAAPILAVAQPVQLLPKVAEPSSLLLPLVAAEVAEVSDERGSYTEAQTLHARKKMDPRIVLTEKEKVTLLHWYINQGRESAQSISGKAGVIVVGPTGAGKSTFLNYLLGCTMHAEREDADAGSDADSDDEDGQVINVLPPNSGGTRDVVFGIGHTNRSETFLPKTAEDTERDAYGPFAYCDCPGFKDNRWVEVNIANAVNIRRVLTQAQSVRLVLLIPYDALKISLERGGALSSLLETCTQLFGTREKLEFHKESILLGITHVPLDKKLESVRKKLVKNASDTAIAQMFAARMFLYDPMDRGNPTFSNREAIKRQIALLKPLSQREGSHLFQTVLTDRDECALRELSDRQRSSILSQLARYDYWSVQQSWHLLEGLRAIGHRSVENNLNMSRECLVDHLNRLTLTFHQYCSTDAFTQATDTLNRIEEMRSCFSSDADHLDFPDLAELRSHYTHCKERSEGYRVMQDQLAASIQQQHEDKASYEEQISMLRAEIEVVQSRYEANRAALQEERTSALRAKEEAIELATLLSASASDVERLKREKDYLDRDYEDRLSALERERGVSNQDYQRLLSRVEQKQAARVSGLASLETQNQASFSQLQVSLPSEAFGAQAWKHYFGVEVDSEPELPSNIEEILNSSAPFMLESENFLQRVRDNHILVLIPSMVDNVPFTLTKLGELAKRYFPNSEDGYSSYTSDVRSQFGFQSPSSSYWVLLTRDVLKKSKTKSYKDQQLMVRRHPGYDLPEALEVASGALLYYARHNQTRLFGNDPWTYVWCSPRQLLKNGSPIIVGAFESTGLNIAEPLIDPSDGGTAGLRRL